MNEIKYIKQGDYYIPDLEVEEGKKYQLGKYGLMKMNHMKENEKEHYFQLLLDNKLSEYLHGFEVSINIIYDDLTEKFMIINHVTEDLKEKNHMKWAQEMNNIRNCVEEIIFTDYIATNYYIKNKCSATV